MIILISYLKEDVGYESSLSIQAMAYNEAVDCVAQRLAKYPQGEFHNIVISNWGNLCTLDINHSMTYRNIDSVFWPGSSERERIFKCDVSTRLAAIHQVNFAKKNESENKLRKEIEAALTEKYQKEIDNLRAALDKAAKAFTEGK